MGFNGESNYFLVPVFICPGLHILFVDLNEYFSCKEFDCLTVYCPIDFVQLKAVEKTQ